MFDLYLKYIQWKQIVKGYLLGKLNNKTIPERIIEDANIAFMSGKNIFRVYLMDTSDSDLSLLDYVENYDKSSIEAELDLHLLYFKTVEKATRYYMWFGDVYVISQNKGYNKYLEVYRKNYKQSIDKDIK